MKPQPGAKLKLFKFKKHTNRSHSVASTCRGLRAKLLGGGDLAEPDSSEIAHHPQPPPSPRLPRLESVCVKYSMNFTWNNGTPQSFTRTIWERYTCPMHLNPPKVHAISISKILPSKIGLNKTSLHLNASKPPTIVLMHLPNL